MYRQHNWSYKKPVTIAVIFDHRLVFTFPPPNQIRYERNYNKLSTCFQAPKYVNYHCGFTVLIDHKVVFTYRNTL